MKKKEAPIGVFDSGIGGLTVLSELQKTLPGESFIYFCDQKNMPYGSKKPEQVEKIVGEVVEFLVGKGCKAVVAACNTATSVASGKLRKEYGIPIIGIEPAIKKAFVKNGSKETLVLATPVTLKEKKFQSLLTDIGCGERCHILPSENLAEMIEKHLMKNHSIFAYSKDIENYLKKAIAGFDLDSIDTIVLGCTHYGFLSPYFNKILPSSVDIIDGSYGTARYLRKVLEEKDLLKESDFSSVEFFTSDKSVANINEICSNILNEYL